MQNTTTPSTTIDHLATAGSLNCKSNELCPNVVVEWDKQQKDKLHLDVALTSTYQYYDINGLTFLLMVNPFLILQLEKLSKSILTV
ncbi:hypothetical protein ACT4_028_00730 [Acinetobacter sp. NBRC 100985]|nr:hypothetical protein ACT4_028_00730 [Acinetobacter sp. NBRC 100985]